MRPLAAEREVREANLHPDRQVLEAARAEEGAENKQERVVLEDAEGPDAEDEAALQEDPYLGHSGELRDVKVSVR